MTRVLQTKTSFTAGELDPVLYGRLDLRAQEEGAAKLTNVVVLPTGGVCRRPGMRFVSELTDGERLVSYDDGINTALIIFSAFKIVIVEDGAIVRTFPEVEWSREQITEMAWARQKNRLIIVHPDVEPHILTRTDSDWDLDQGLPWETEGIVGLYSQPFARYSDNTIELALHQINGGPLSGPASGTVDVVANGEIFSIEHERKRTRLKFRGVEIEINGYISPSIVRGTTAQTIAEPRATRDWFEQAFSPARGWPRTVCFHQNRLVIGGSRDFPDYVWMSRTGRYFDFNLGDGLDDEAIAFRLNSDRLDIIRAIYSGRRLQIFTDSGEWVVTGNPLTPGSVAVDLQTRIGSYAVGRIDPIDVDGATLFVGTSGRDLREFIFSDSEQAYQAADLALLSRHLMVEPRALCFDSQNRLVVMVREDGDAALISIDRNSNVIAWSRMAVEGRIVSCSIHEGTVHFIVVCNGRKILQRFDHTLGVDQVWNGTSGLPQDEWAGINLPDGLVVELTSDGTSLGNAEIVSGTIVTPIPVSTLEIGIPFTHEIRPLPVVVGNARGVAQDQLFRPIRLSFRLLDTAELNVDTGSGLRLAPLAANGNSRFSGDIRLAARGWRRPNTAPAWRIQQAAPTPFCLLSVTTEMKVNS